MLSDVVGQVVAIVYTLGVEHSRESLPKFSDGF